MMFYPYSRRAAPRIRHRQTCFWGQITVPEGTNRALQDARQSTGTRWAAKWVGCASSSQCLYRSTRKKKKLENTLCPLVTDMSEADLIYTETLMQRGRENYTGKEIVILGGGDGGLLWELLKEKPKFVTMLEVRELRISVQICTILRRVWNYMCVCVCLRLFLQIDDIVMKACSEHMRSICGDCLDKKKGDNYEVRFWNFHMYLWISVSSQVLEFSIKLKVLRTFFFLSLQK